MHVCARARMCVFVCVCVDVLGEDSQKKRKKTYVCVWRSWERTQKRKRVKNTDVRDDRNRG